MPVPNRRPGCGFPCEEAGSAVLSELLAAWRVYWWLSLPLGACRYRAAEKPVLMWGIPCTV